MIKLNEQLVFLRKQKNITQEDLAQVLGVTNQAVSKWESGSCCPDIALLPQIAAHFSVTVDELLGYKPADHFNDVYLKIKGLFEDAQADESFDLAYKLSFVLHECALAKRCAGYLPWDTGKHREADSDFYDWGYSVYTGPEGVTVMKGSAVLIASNKLPKRLSPDNIRDIFNALRPYGDKNTLRAFYALYALTMNDSDLYASVDDIAAECMLPAEAVSSALDSLPIESKALASGQSGYRIEGSAMHIPTILSLLTQ